MAKTTTAKRATKKSKVTASEPVVKMTIPTEKAAPAAPLTAAPKASKAVAKTAPTYDQISARAYEIWAEKGYPAGQDIENWRQAEEELCGGSLTNAA